MNCIYPVIIFYYLRLINEILFIFKFCSIGVILATAYLHGSWCWNIKSKNEKLGKERWVGTSWYHEERDLGLKSSCKFKRY